MKQELAPIAVGIVAGLAAAVAASRLLASRLYEISPVEPVVYRSVTGLLVFTAILAGAVPARRAATVDPAIALREQEGSSIRLAPPCGPLARPGRQ